MSEPRDYSPIELLALAERAALAAERLADTCFAFRFRRDRGTGCGGRRRGEMTMNGNRSREVASIFRRWLKRHWTMKAGGDIETSADIDARRLPAGSPFAIHGHRRFRLVETEERWRAYGYEFPHAGFWLIPSIDSANDPLFPVDAMSHGMLADALADEMAREDACAPAAPMIEDGTAGTVKAPLPASGPHVPGAKLDAGKLRYDLVPPSAIRALAAILTYGASKYTPDGWRTVTPFRERYTAALMRHIEAWRAGEECDPESGMPHLAHAACNIAFLIEGPSAESGVGA